MRTSWRSTEPKGIEDHLKDLCLIYRGEMDNPHDVNALMDEERAIQFLKYNLWDVERSIMETPASWRYLYLEEKGSLPMDDASIARKIYDFASEGMPVTLSLSLHAPNDEIRKQIMPAANAYPINEVLDACRYYVEKTGRRVIFEYALIRNVNCDLKHAEELARRLRGLQCHVNLIPLNDVKERNLEAPSKQEVAAFQRRLELKNISATVRREMGADIDGACGQLRRKALESGVKI